MLTDPIAEKREDFELDARHGLENLTDLGGHFRLFGRRHRL